MNNLIYNKKFLLMTKYISLITSLFLTVVETAHIISSPIRINNEINLHNLQLLIGNCSVTVFLVLLSIYPHKLEFLAIASFYYGVSCTFFENNNPMGICMYFLGNAVMYARGYFIHNSRQKLCLISLFYFLLVITKVRFGRTVFINELIEKLGYSFVLGIFTFLVLSNKNTKSSEKTDKKNILNISVYAGLTKSDAPLLQKVLENKQYKVIASEVSRAEGTVRNRLNKVYDVLGVMDRMGFISTYMGYEIVFKDEKKKESLPKAKNLP